MTIVELLVQAGLVRSKSEARRLVQQGGVSLDGQRISEIDTRVAPPPTGIGTGKVSGGVVLRVGRRRFLRLLHPNSEKNPAPAEPDSGQGEADGVGVAQP